MIDVVIPAWTETLDYLVAALDSLSGDMHGIVVLNGPNAGDMLAEIMSEPMFHEDPYTRAQWTVPHTKPGCFLCNARNHGASLVTTDYFAFLDADDFFLPGIAAVIAAAEGHRGAVGQMLVASQDGKMERVRSQKDGAPHTGTYVIRRDSFVPFDVWAPHQISYRGWHWNDIWWKATGPDDFVWVDEIAMTYRWNWSPQQATRRYWEYDGFIGLRDG